MHVIDTFVLYQFIRKLSTPFEHWKMYKMGVIDEHGNFLQPKEERTPEQLASYSYLDVLILNIKKALSKIPGGSTRIATFAAALYLLREGKTFTDADYLTEQYHEKFNDYLKEARDILYEDEGGGGASPISNTMSGGSVEIKDNPMNTPKKILRRHKLKEEIVNMSSNDSLGDYDFPMNVPKKILNYHKHHPGKHNKDKQQPYQDPYASNTYTRVVTEGRDAPLYHGCTMRNAEYNLMNNGIFGYSAYGRGVSLTRNKNFAQSWGPVVFELDQSKLIQNHKIRPYNFFGDPKVDDSPHRTTRAKGILNKKSQFVNQSEETVPNDIKPLDRYITAIYLADYVLDDAIKHGTDDDKVQLILAHPKYAGTFKRISGGIFL